MCLSTRKLLPFIFVTPLQFPYEVICQFSFIPKVKIWLKNTNRKTFLFLERLFSTNCCWRPNLRCKRDNINTTTSNNKITNNTNNNTNNNNTENRKTPKGVFVFCINGKIQVKQDIRVVRQSRNFFILLL